MASRVRRKWVLNPFERPEHLFLEAAPYIVAILILRKRLITTATGEVIDSFEALEKCTALRLDGCSENVRLFRQGAGAEVMTISSLSCRLSAPPSCTPFHLPSAIAPPLAAWRWPAPSHSRLLPRLTASPRASSGL